MVGFEDSPVVGLGDWEVVWGWPSMVEGLFVVVVGKNVELVQLTVA